MPNQKEQCSFNHRELPNCDICGKLKCKHPKKQETIDTLTRDLTKVGSISKSEAKRRIEDFIFKFRQEAYQEGFILGAHTTSEQANEIHAVELEEETRKAYERGKLENIMMIDRKISKKFKGSKEYSQALKEAYEQGRKYEFYRCREAKIKTAEQSYLAGRGGAIRQVLDFVENENEKSGREEEKPVWNCHHGVQHEVGCPHREWTKEQLSEALIQKKKFEMSGLAGKILAKLKSIK